MKSQNGSWKVKKEANNTNYFKKNNDSVEVPVTKSIKMETNKDLDPYQKFYLPCSHYVTNHYINKQALINLCVDRVTCIKCKAEYSISILERNTHQATGYTVKPFSNSDIANVNKNHQSFSNNKKSHYQHYDKCEDSLFVSKNRQHQNSNHMRFETNDKTRHDVSCNNGTNMRSFNKVDKNRIIESGVGQKVIEARENMLPQDKTHMKSSNVVDKKRTDATAVDHKVIEANKDKLSYDKTSVNKNDFIESSVKKGGLKNEVTFQENILQNITCANENSSLDTIIPKEYIGLSTNKDICFKENIPTNIETITHMSHSVMSVNSSTSNYKETRPVPAPRNVKSDGSYISQSVTSKNNLNLISNFEAKNQVEIEIQQNKGAINKSSDRFNHNNCFKDNKQTNSYKPKLNEPASSEQVLYICLECSMPIIIPKNHRELGHTICSMEDGIPKLISREKNNLKLIKTDISSKLVEVKNYKAAISSAVALLPRVYDVINKNKMEKAHDYEGDIILDKLKNLIQEDISTEMFMNAQNFRHQVSNLAAELESWKNKVDLCTIPSFFISSWLKSSIGILIYNATSCGKEAFAIKNSLLAKLAFQGDRLLLSPFLQDVSIKEEDFHIPFELVESIFDKEASLSFMKISYNNEPCSGPIIIRINTATFWGKQFRHMCTAEFGPSFIGTKFFRNCLKGKEGHHIWGGDYQHEDGSGGKTIMEESTTVELFPRPLVKGLIAARFGHEDKSTIFRIYLNGVKDLFMEPFAFAQIEEGLDILQHISNREDITKTVILDVGIIAELR